jgi:hypothetical protein
LSNPPATSQPPNINQRIDQFVLLRDKIKMLDDAHKEKMKPFREALETLGNIMLKHRESIGADSVAGKSGTVYRTVKHSASIADVNAFWEFVVANEAWDMLDKKANVTAVGDFIEENQTTPPGINFTTVMSVGVRRK